MTRSWLVLARTRCGLLAGLLGGVLAGCASAGIPDEELPVAPIAIAYRDAEESRKRAEILAKPDERANKAGVARVNDIQRLFGGTGDALQALLQQSVRLALVDPRTGAPQMLDAAPRGAEPYAWSPDRTALSFTLASDGPGQIYVYERTSGEVRRATHGAQSHGHGALGPGGRAAYARSDVVDGRTVLRIWLTEARLASPRPRTAGPTDRTPVFSPDGRSLVYVSRGTDGVDTLQVIDPDGEDPPRLLARGRDPVFTPDGGWVVYCARGPAGWRLWKARLDGSGRVPLGHAVGEVDEETHPAVSPDGRFVAYVGESEHRQTLRVRRFDGTGDRVLLEDGDGASPTW